MTPMATEDMRRGVEVLMTERQSKNARQSMSQGRIRRRT
jgi:hypothetical protein